eukprot:15474146-Alexandrium_andersonii.AAC.1
MGSRRPRSQQAERAEHSFPRLGFSGGRSPQVSVAGSGGAVLRMSPRSFESAIWGRGVPIFADSEPRRRMVSRLGLLAERPSPNLE